MFSCLHLTSGFVSTEGSCSPSAVHPNQVECSVFIWLCFFLPDVVTRADSCWNGEIIEGPGCCQGHRTSCKHPGLHTALISLRDVSPIQHVCMWLELAHTRAHTCVSDRQNPRFGWGQGCCQSQDSGDSQQFSLCVCRMTCNLFLSLTPEQTEKRLCKLVRSLLQASGCSLLSPPDSVSCCGDSPPVRMSSKYT